MPIHKVSFSTPERPLGGADVIFKIELDDKTLGKLKISKGSVEWVHRNDQYGYHLDWQDFDKVMRDKGKK